MSEERELKPIYDNFILDLVKRELHVPGYDLNIEFVMNVSKADIEHHTIIEPQEI